MQYCTNSSTETKLKVPPVPLPIRRLIYIYIWSNFNILDGSFGAQIGLSLVFPELVNRVSASRVLENLHYNYEPQKERALSFQSEFRNII